MDRERKRIAQGSGLNRRAFLQTGAMLTASLCVGRVSVVWPSATCSSITAT